MKWDKDTVYDNTLLAEKIKGISERLKTKIEIEKVSIVPTSSNKEFQFTLLDHIKTQRGNRSGYSVVTGSTTQATDVSQDIGSPIHMEISLTESINLLNLLGSSIDIRLFPIYDAPNDDILESIRKNIDSFTARYNYSFEDYSSLKLDSLFFGTTATGNTHKELPNRHDLVKEGTQIIVTAKFGLLACLSLYIITKMDGSLFDKMDKNGIQESRLRELKDLAIKNLTEPKASLGKVIAKFLPDFETEFDFGSHILVAHPISKNGISSLDEVSRLTNSELIIDNIPLVDENVADFASNEFLISNSTASTSNTSMILVSEELSPTVIGELNKIKFDPIVIGRIGKRGAPGITINRKGMQKA